MIDTNHIISKLKAKRNFRTDIELANYLEIPPNNIAKWRLRNSVDLEIIITKSNVDLNWLFLNKESSDMPSAKPCEDCIRNNRTIDALADSIDLYKSRLAECEKKTMPKTMNPQKEAVKPRKQYKM